MKRGVIDKKEFFDWIQEIHDGKIERKTVTVNLCNDVDEVAASWQILKAWLHLLLDTLLHQKLHQIHLLH